MKTFLFPALLLLLGAALLLPSVSAIGAEVPEGGTQEDTATVSKETINAMETAPETERSPLATIASEGKTIRIYIDQGHNPTGTWNTGAVGNGIFEQDINYEVGIRLAALLRESPRFEVKLSRPTAGTVLGYDNNSALNARSAEANAWGADYFISIHSNAAESYLANGVEAFSYSDTDEGYPLGVALVDALVEATGLYRRGMFVRPELSVLRKTEMPAVLVELGFVSNPAEAALLSTRPDLFAEALYTGILNYFASRS
jgi:N-acetylmuramoyl-L-alanine amidase